MRSTSAKVMAECIRTKGIPTWRPLYNIGPAQNILAVRLDEGGEREWAFLRWGFVPSWAKDVKESAKSINARAETVAEKPSFRDAFKKRRCLISADGYYEWHGRAETAVFLLSE